MVNLVVSVSKCAFPTSTVFPYNYHKFNLIMSRKQIHTINKQKWRSTLNDKQMKVNLFIPLLSPPHLCP